MGKRIVKSCNNCNHIIDFPYIHCDLGCIIIDMNKYSDSNIIKMKPENKEYCKMMRVYDGGHTDDCYISVMLKNGGNDMDAECTCGFDAILTKEIT